MQVGCTYIYPCSTTNISLCHCGWNSIACNNHSVYVLMMWGLTQAPPTQSLHAMCMSVWHHLEYDVKILSSSCSCLNFGSFSAGSYTNCTNLYLIAILLCVMVYTRTNVVTNGPKFELLRFLYVIVDGVVYRLPGSAQPYICIICAQVGAFKCHTCIISITN